MDFDEADLYKGLAALHWRVMSHKSADLQFYQSLIERNGGTALELGCGAGRLVLAYLRLGLDVEGVDISSDQLAMCREAADEMGLSPVLYEQKMQELNLQKRYSTIYIPCGSFQCVMGRNEALEALKRMYSHLLPGGTLAMHMTPGNVNYYLDVATHKPRPIDWSNPSKEPTADIQLEGGRRLVVYNNKYFEDLVDQYGMREREYELYEAGRLVREEIHTGQTQWYHRNELLLMLEMVGFSSIKFTRDFSDESFNEIHSTMLNSDQKRKVLSRMKRIEGQIGGIGRMIQEDAYCVDVLHQLSAATGGLEQVGKIVLSNHIETCVTDAFQEGSDRDRQTKIEELVHIFSRYGRK